MIVGSPISPGKTVTVIRETALPAGTHNRLFAIDSDSILLSLWVGDLASGTVTVRCFTQADEGQEKEIITFPVLSAPSTELLLQKAALALAVIRVEVVCTEQISIDLRAKGIGLGESTVKIQGADAWQVSQTNITTVPAQVIPTSLTARSGLVIKNNSTATLYLAEVAVKATPSVGYPLGAGESLAFDLIAGQEVWGVASAGTIDVRIAESGGS